MKSILPLFMKLLGFAACLLAVTAANAQTGSLTGVVQDSSGNPLVGATVIIDGSSTGVSAGIGGEFTIQAQPGAVLLVSYVGYNTQSVTVGTQTRITVTLEEEGQLLDQVVVVGYGTQRKVNLTGAVGSITSADFEGRPIMQSSAALQGLVPGVTVTTQAGSPGGDAAMIRIRGLGTFGNSEATPLVLIDGVEGSMNEVNPELIESISVLKDAASASIYGSRAANGVILVTTKRGSSREKFSVQYKGYVGFQRPTNLPNLVNTVDFMELENVAEFNENGNLLYERSFIDSYMANNATDPDRYPNTDWQKEILDGSGFLHSHFVSLGASSGNINTLTSFGYQYQEAIIKNSDFARYTIRNNMDIKFSDKLSMRFDLQLVNADRLTVPQESTLWNYINRMPPNIASRFTNGVWGPGWNGTNPAAIIEDGGNRKTNNVNITGTLALVYKPLEWLSFEGMIAPRYNTTNLHNFIKYIQTYDVDGRPIESSGLSEHRLTERSTRTFYGNYQFLIRTKNTFADNHNISTLWGSSKETYDSRYLEAYRQGYIYPDYDIINAGNDDEFKDNAGSRSQWALLSYFGRINYDYKSKYLFEANLRIDGSSRFRKDDRWGYFPSVSGGWRLTEESFMAPARHILSEFKLRASWGQLGNQNIGSSYYPTVESLATGSISMADNIYNLVTVNTLANPYITWEKSTMTDVGFDMTLFQKLTVTGDWYYKTTDGILLQLDIPDIMGAGAPFRNAGRVRNIGWELGVGYSNKWNDFSFGVNANVSDVRNKITKLDGQQSSSIVQNREGYSVNSIYGLKAMGYFQTQEEADQYRQFGITPKAGDIKYFDYDEDGEITAADAHIIGSTIPRYTFGLNLNLGWKGIEFSAFLQGVGKSYGMLNSHYLIPASMGSTYYEMHKDYWRPTNPNATFPILERNSTNTAQNSTHWMRSTAYLRVKNLQLGYSLPKKWMEKAKLGSVFVYVNAQNLFTFDRFWDGYDVEVAYDSSATDGVQIGGGNVYPQVKTFSVGLDIKF